MTVALDLRASAHNLRICCPGTLLQTLVAFILSSRQHMSEETCSPSCSAHEQQCDNMYTLAPDQRREGHGTFHLLDALPAADCGSEHLPGLLAEVAPLRSTIFLPQQVCLQAHQLRVQLDVCLLRLLLLPAPLALEVGVLLLPLSHLPQLVQGHPLRQVRPQLLDGALVLRIRLLAGSVGATLVLPLNVCPDATQLGGGLGNLPRRCLLLPCCLQGNLKVVATLVIPSGALLNDEHQGI
mmetsp:Transcript_20854/g.62761  ORF Transcript_20854/g.62761 Transcript_20854/m.62761 type:complete len:239 (-) Transcript_20854:635-1351(-)